MVKRIDIGKKPAAAKRKAAVKPKPKSKAKPKVKSKSKMATGNPRESLATIQRRERFVEEYLIDGNATRSAIAAGFSEKGASVAGVRLLANAKVLTGILEGRAKLTEKSGIDAQYVMRRMVEVDELDVADILDDSGDILPIRDWPMTWRTLISGIDLSETREGRGADARVYLLKKVKWPDKIKNLEMIGRHINVMAWNEKLALVGPNGGPVEMVTEVVRRIVDPA
jgi:phage terminase small subunit